MPLASIKMGYLSRCVALQKLHVEKNRKRLFSSREASTDKVMQNLHSMQNLHTLSNNLLLTAGKYCAKLCNIVVALEKPLSILYHQTIYVERIADEHKLY